MPEKVCLDDDSLDYILEWTKVHTYYTQRLSNEVFSISDNKVDREIRRLITRAQWKMLSAIAKEDGTSYSVYNVFLSRYLAMEQ